MPDLSQRTLAHAMSVLDGLVPEDADTAFMLRDFWQKKLFEWGFPSWLIDHASLKHFKWTTIIRDLFGGKVTQSSGSIHPVPQLLQEQILRKLTAMAITESEDTSDVRYLRLSLQLDGFDVANGKTIPIDGPVSVTDEKSRLLTSLGASSLFRKQLIAKHLKDAEELFSQGKMHPAMGEARSAFQAAVEDTTSLVQSKVIRNAGGGFKNQIEFLSREAFLSIDEEAAFLSAWGFLSAGAHPGLPPDEAGRVGLILALEFIHVLLLKAKNLI